MLKCASGGVGDPHHGIGDNDDDHHRNNNDDPHHYLDHLDQS